MNEETKRRLAKFIQAKLHDDHLPGYYFDEEDVYGLIDIFFDVEELIKERDKIQEKINQYIDEDDGDDLPWE